MQVMISPTQQNIRCIVSLGKMKYRMNVSNPRQQETRMIGPMQPMSPLVQQANNVRIVNRATEYTAARKTDFGSYIEAIVATMYDSQRVKIPKRM
mmetsp:Transcript_27694/g.31870  ORF Transcript_27694/g.31870 Transcript_27694/m.31870 type:complete len:95 (-) Transcript_27694:641-925(-)